jgi:hypothetical protein
MGLARSDRNGSAANAAMGNATGEAIACLLLALWREGVNIWTEQLLGLLGLLWSRLNLKLDWGCYI